MFVFSDLLFLFFILSYFLTRLALNFKRKTLKKRLKYDSVIEGHWTEKNP